MKRKDFLQRLAVASTGLFFSRLAGIARPEPVNTFRPGLIPPYLQPGDTIGITCPASPMEAKDLLDCRNALTRWGFQTSYGTTVDNHWQRFGGTDDERAADLQQMLDNDEIRAIVFARGGYGVMRMMDKLNWDKFVTKPKWLVGYSDITAFHCHVHTLYGIPTIHADMGNGFNDTDDASSVSLRKMLTGARQPYVAEPFALNRPGEAWGKIVGGNLSMITAMQGSKSALDTTGKILFIEDVSEYKYTIDRMMLNLKRSGRLDQLAGLLVGGFTATKKEEEEIEPVKNKFLLTVEELIYEKVQEYSYPVAFHFPAGHMKLNLALKLGGSYHLQVNGIRTLLTEENPAVPVIRLPLPDSTSLLPDSLIR